MSARLRQQLKTSYKKIPINGTKIILYPTSELIMISLQHTKMLPMPKLTVVVKMPDVANLGK